MTSRTVQFSTSEPITHYYAENKRSSLHWYQPADIERFKADFKHQQRNKVTSTTMTSRTVQFSTSEPITHYYAENKRSNLHWYQPADIERFKADRLEDVQKMKNRSYSDSDEQICFWGLECLIVPSVRSKTLRAKKQVERAVLWKQDNAHSDETFQQASQWAAIAARMRGSHYSKHL